MSFISDSSIPETGLKAPSLVFPSLSNYKNEDRLKNDRPDSQQSDIYYASQLIKLRSELRSPYNHSSKYKSVTDLTSLVGNTRVPMTNRTQSLPNVQNFDEQSYDGKDDESEIVSKQIRQNKFFVSGSNHLNLPSQESLFLPFISQPLVKEQTGTQGLLLAPEEESILSSDTECDHNVQRRTITKKPQKKPQAFLVSISPSSAAAATVARSRRTKSKQCHIIKRNLL